MWDDKKVTSNVWLSIADLPQSLHAVASDSKEYVSDKAAATMRVVPVGTLIVSFKLTLGRLAYAGRDLFTNEAIAALHDLDTVKVDQRFLYWALSAFDWNKAAEGDVKVKGKTLNKAKLKVLPVILPPLEEQQRIVAILDEAFEGLDCARANAEANLQSARELFETLRDFILNNAIGEKIKRKLSECFRLKSGENLTAKDMIEGPYSVYGGNGIAGTHNYSNLTGENVIIGRVGALCGNARFVDEEIWLTDNAFKVTQYQFDLDPCFLAHLLNSKNLRALARQSAQPVISNSSLSDLDLAFPKDIKIQEQLAEILEMAEAQTALVTKQYLQKLDDLNDLRQSLLQKAFAGELT